MLTAVGFLAGVLGGLLGIGGGIVMMPILRLVVGLSPATAAGTCIVPVFFTSLGGSFRHYKLGHINFKSIFGGGVCNRCLFYCFFVFHREAKLVRPWDGFGVFSCFFANDSRGMGRSAGEPAGGE